MLIVTPDGTITGFCLANPKATGERDQAASPPTARTRAP
jgi:hypothetical protein